MNVLLAVAVVGSQGFSVDRESLSRQPGDCTASEAYSVARSLAESLASQTNSSAFLRLESSRTFSRHWSITWPDELSVIIHARTREVVSATDERKSPTWHRFRGQNLRLSLESRESCLNKVRELMSLFGIGTNVHWSTTRLFGEDEENRASFFATLNPLYRGVVVQTAFANVIVDRLDGKLYDLTKKWQFIIEAEDLVLDEARARARGEEIYETYTSTPDRYPPSAQSPKLAYIRPETGYGAVGYSKEDYPIRVRLTYVVAFGADKVFLDAGTGACLGGFKAKERP